MATLTVPLYREARLEVWELFKEPRPQWVLRLLESQRVSQREVPPSVEVEALAEALHRRLGAILLLARKAERRGWAVELNDDGLRIVTALPVEQARKALEADGVLHLAQRLGRPIAEGSQEVLR
jgi:hypothetical protein